MFSTWFCLNLPWHKLRKVEKLSSSSDKIQCSCGKYYAINYDVRAFLPWDKDLEKLYQDINRFMAQEYH